MSDTSTLLSKATDTAFRVGGAVLADPGNIVEGAADVLAIATPATNGAVRLAAIEDLLARLHSFLSHTHPVDFPAHLAAFDAKK